MTHGMYVYPWDLEEEGASAVLPRLRDIGIDAISLAVSYHAGKFVRPHAPQRRVYFPEDGTIYFPPDMSRYGLIKPLPNSRVGVYDPLRELARHGSDFRVTAWTVGLHNTPLGVAHPSLVVRNCFGDPLWNSLCPSAPDVRAYLVALCADLAANQPLAEIAIETPGWQAFRHGHHHEFELIDLTPRAQILLGMCFCDSCLAAASAAGIEGDALRRRTVVELEQFFTDGTEPATDPGTDADWRAFHALRAATVTSLVTEVRAAMPQAVGLAVVPSTQSPNSLCWIEGSDLAALAKLCRLEVPAYQLGVAAILADAAEVRAAAGAEATIGYILRPTYPHLLSAADVRSAVKGLEAAGANGLAFYNYGHMRLSSLDWIAAALA
ncbi:MAG: hypothetical protein EOP22_03595 [Hyphomicrobiales bacterium]|nr:MAG: hypothetical protein EOP22_03595 [Hyphomicrobiales bacterium]